MGVCVFSTTKPKIKIHLASTHSNRETPINREPQFINYRMTKISTLAHPSTNPLYIKQLKQKKPGCNSIDDINTCLNT